MDATNGTYGGGNWPLQADEMKYNFKIKPNNHQRKPRFYEGNWL